MFLVIAEKPSVAKTISQVIGAYQNEEGYLKGRDCMVSWCVGHLAEYAQPEAYGSQYEKWDFGTLPINPRVWKLLVSADKRKQFDVLRELLNRPDVEYVVNACDAGREGELIFQRVYELSKSSLPVKRLWISSMEDTAIQDGFANLKNGKEYENLCRAAICRAQADWLVGINGTRAYTTTYHKKLTVGRVQTPTLFMLVEREKQIRNFQKEKYFNVSLDCDGLSVRKEKIFDKEAADRLTAACMGAEALVQEVTVKGRTEKPPKLYDLTSLQRECNRFYGYSAKQTLDLVQSLYEKKLVTYPRTDSQYLSDDMEDTAGKVIGIVLEKYDIDPFSYPAKPSVRLVLNSGKVTDHHAIIPTAELAKCQLSSLPEKEQKVLKAIALHLLCATAESYRYDETDVLVLCQGEEFRAKGKTIREEGWKNLEARYRGEKEKGTEGLSLPPVEKGQKFKEVKVKATEHFTSPPKRFSEDTLLSAMETAGNQEFDKETEKKGLGTPATRASIIEKLVSCGYALRKGKQIAATDSGMELISVLPEFLTSAKLTAEWENQLLLMEKGKVRSEEFLSGIEELVGQMLDGCRALALEERQRFQSREEIGTCPVCGNPVYEGKKNFYCGNRECRFALWKENRYLESMKKKLDKKMAQELLNQGRTHVCRLYSAKKDSYFDADILLDLSDGRANFKMEFPKGGKKKK